MPQFTKIFIFLAIFLFCLFLTPKTLKASNFDTSYNTSYLLDKNGTAEVSQEITIKNKDPEFFASEYTLSVIGKSIKDISAFEFVNEKNKLTKKILETKIGKSNEDTTLTILFERALVGKQKSRVFNIEYKIDNLAFKNGEVWDLSIPRLSSEDQLENYTVSLSIPKSFGILSYISPKPKKTEDNLDNYSFFFDKESLSSSTVTAIFGEFQVFKLSLIYHLENVNLQEGNINIALPPDSIFQKVFYNSIEPKPKRIYLDDDGNWLASYSLEANKKIDVFVSLYAQIFAKPQDKYHKISGLDNNFYLSETNFWQTNNEKIKKFSSILKTPKSIYNFVSSKLSYNYDKIGSKPSRLGAIGALDNPSFAVCSEFTDLFIAMTRSVGIPSREINGYAFASNPRLQPLSLVADTLHSWPEYWNTELGIWKPVDPTWQNTSGINYFDSFDLNHIVFAIHGKEDNYPYPAGSYKNLEATKDVQVEIANLPEGREESYDIILSEKPISFPFWPFKRNFRLTNTGKISIYDSSVNIIIEGARLTHPQEYNIGFIAPFDIVELPLEFNIDMLPTFKPVKIDIVVEGNHFEYTVPLIEIFMYQAFTIFFMLLTIGGFLFVCLHFNSILKGISK